MHDRREAGASVHSRMRSAMHCEHGTCAYMHSPLVARVPTRVSIRHAALLAAFQEVGIQK